MTKKTIQMKHQKQRRQFAIGSMIIGISLLILSAVINVIFIVPSDFKSQFRDQQLDDCLMTSTAQAVCYDKFGN